MGYNPKGTVNETLDEAERKVLSIVKNRRSTEFRTVQDVLFKAQANLEKLAEKKGDITGLPSGWRDLDKITSGFHENELIIIAARPAMGKTAFALNIATNIAINTDKTVALFNLEMGSEQLAMRMLSSLGQIEGQKLRTGNLLNNDWKRVNEAISQLADAKLYMDDTPGITIGEIRAKCRRLASSENGLGIVIIDYLQLISSSGKYGSNRQQEVADISRSLKTMAMELKVPVIALAQLSRAVEGRENKRPNLSDLRESGSIEQDADIVSFLYRDDYYNKEADNENHTSESELIIAKHRNGPTATIQLLFKRDTSTFLNYHKESKGGYND
jgi:replicative DNA helicase